MSSFALDQEDRVIMAAQGSNIIAGFVSFSFVLLGVIALMDSIQIAASSLHRR